MGIVTWTPVHAPGSPFGPIWAASRRASPPAGKSEVCPARPSDSNAARGLGNRSASRPQRVSDAILDPELIARFMFGPLLREEEILHIRNEPKVDGAFTYKVRRGEQEIDHVGTYLELDPSSRIVFTWSIAGHGDDDPSIVTIDITPTADGCSLSLMHEMDEKWTDFVERSRGGWRKMLGVLATLL